MFLMDNEAYREGYDAGIRYHMEFKPIEDNPYDDRSGDDESAGWLDWEKGFEDAGMDS